MKKYTRCLLVWLLIAAAVWNFTGCSGTQQPAEESTGMDQTTEQEGNTPEEEEQVSAEIQYRRTPQEIAQQFAQQWMERWTQIEPELTMTNHQGRAFLVDLDGDGLDELVFLYDNYIDYNALVYRISGEQAEELGGFTVSNASSAELTFSLYQGAQPVLYYQTVQTHASQEGSSETEESFISLQNGELSRSTLYYTSYGETNTYYDSVEAGANEISKDDYDLLRIGLLGSGEASQEIVLTAENVFDCADQQAVQDGVQALLEQ